MNWLLETENPELNQKLPRWVKILWCDAVCLCVQLCVAPSSSTSALTMCLTGGILHTAKTTLPILSMFMDAANWRERGRHWDTVQVPVCLPLVPPSSVSVSASLPSICPSLVCLSTTCLCCSCADPAGADSVWGGGVRAGECCHLSVAPCPGHDGELHFGPLPAEVPHGHPGRSRRLQEAVWEGETGRLQCAWEGDGSLFPPASLTPCLSLLQDPSIRGIFHFSSKQQMTKYEMGVSMAQAFNLPSNHLIPVNIHHQYIDGLLHIDCRYYILLSLVQLCFGLFIYEHTRHDTWGNRQILQINFLSNIFFLSWLKLRYYFSV